MPIVRRNSHITIILSFSSEQMTSILLFGFLLNVMTFLQMGDMYQFKLEHGSFKKIANIDSTYTVFPENNRNQISLIFKRYRSMTDSIIGTMNNTRSSQPIYSIFNGCKSETCSMDINEDLCYVISTMKWYDDDINTDDNTTSNSTTTVELELCQPTLLSARTMSSASLDVVTITTTTLSTSSEMVVTTHLPYSITQLKINPLEYTLLFNGSPVFHAWSATINKPSVFNLQRSSFYILDIEENPPNDLTFLLSLSMVIDELAKTLNIGQKST